MDLPDSMPLESQNQICFALERELVMFKHYHAALSRDIDYPPRGVAPLSRSARDVLFAPDTEFLNYLQTTTTSPLMHGSVDQKYLEDIHFGLFPFAS